MFHSCSFACDTVNGSGWVQTLRFLYLVIAKFTFLQCIFFLKRSWMIGYYLSLTIFFQYFLAAGIPEELDKHSDWSFQNDQSVCKSSLFPVLKTWALQVKNQLGDGFLLHLKLHLNTIFQNIVDAMPSTGITYTILWTSKYILIVGLCTPASFWTSSFVRNFIALSHSSGNITGTRWSKPFVVWYVSNMVSSSKSVGRSSLSTHYLLIASCHW